MGRWLTMRLGTLSLLLVFGLSAAPLATGTAQTPTDTTTKVKKPPSKLGKIAKRLADTAATAAAGVGVQSLLGSKAGGVANVLGVGAAATPCGAAAVSSGAIVGAAKNIVKKAADTAQPVAAVPCPQAAGLQGLVPGGGAAAVAAAAAAASPAGAMGGMGGMKALAAMTPIGLAVTAAPLAGGAVKGLKGMLGGKPQDKIAMLRELGKGTLLLKSVKFIQGTAEMEPGFEPSLAALGEAIGLAEGTYLLYVPAEAGDKGEQPDTALARKRLQKLWAAVLVNGVQDQRIIPVTALPAALAEGRKPPKPGQARVEVIRLVTTP